MRSPMRAEALKAACTTPSLPVKQRLYKCASCGKEERCIDVHVDHINPAPYNEDWNSFMSRILLGSVSVIGNDVKMEDGSINLLSNIITDLQILCEACHKIKTKDEAGVRKQERKSHAS